MTSFQNAAANRPSVYSTRRPNSCNCQATIDGTMASSIGATAAWRAYAASATANIASASTPASTSWAAPVEVVYRR